MGESVEVNDVDLSTILDLSDSLLFDTVLMDGGADVSGWFNSSNGYF
jgi:hypothetical protein